MMRGCSTAYPSTTRPARASNAGRFSGCAIVPTRRVATPRGSRVSASSVITYRTASGTAGGRPWVGMNVVSGAARRRRFSSRSFPRLRSHPIHFPSSSFHVRLRCNKRNRSPASGAGPCRWLRRAIPSTAAARSRSSPGIVSVAASVQSESRAKRRSPSGLAR